MGRGTSSRGGSAKVMKLLIAGTRDLRISLEEIEAEVRRLRLKVTTVLSGQVGEVDLAGERWAEAKGITVECFPADWENYGKSAGPRRNRTMAEIADYGLIFWSGESRGTRNCLMEMRKLGKPVTVIWK